MPGAEYDPTVATLGAARSPGWQVVDPVGVPGVIVVPDVPVPDERGVVDEDLLLELTQLRAWIETELVGERRARPLIRGQRIGLTTRLVERGDQHHPQGFVERMLGDGRLEVPITALGAPRRSRAAHHVSMSCRRVASSRAR